MKKHKGFTHAVLALILLAMASTTTGCGGASAAPVAPKKEAGIHLKEAPVSFGTWVQDEPDPEQKRGAVGVQQGTPRSIWYFKTSEMPDELIFGSFRLYLVSGNKGLIPGMWEGKPYRLYGDHQEIGDAGLVHAEWSRTWSFAINPGDNVKPGKYDLSFKAVPTTWSDEAKNRVPSGDPLFFDLTVTVTK